MDTDTAVVAGLMALLFSIPALIAAWSDRRRPYAGTLLLFTGCALIVWAQRSAPEGYRLDQLPDVVYGVIGALLR
ncbi:hypothetical protein [Sagittula salina]|uniref:50S ribosomal protein L35 n=1 Tax=Sagittula salina TaxID=2820268 RepID=A0A940MNP1_9RHOB|nr:hypothetical protein [Sagittula salina]MBP0482634.1 hypothetical protein [Sagittula salina]